MSGLFRNRFIPPPPVQHPGILLTTAVDVVAPVLSLPTGLETGTTTLSGTVVTDEGNGTLYWVVTTSATQPTSTQIKAGQDHTTTAAPASGNQAVGASGVQNISATGLSVGTYYVHYYQEDLAVNGSNIVNSAAVILGAPVLSTASAAGTGTSTASGSVSTTEAKGSLYWVVSTNSLQPSIAQLRLGLDADGLVGADAGVKAVTISGSQSLAFTGLSSGTVYYFHAVHDDDVGFTSNAITSNSFATTSVGTAVESARMEVIQKGLVRGVKRASVSVATIGDNQVVEAAPGKALVILQYHLVSAGSVSVQFSSGTAGAYLSGIMTMTAGVPHNDAFLVGLMESEVGDPLYLILSDAIQVSGYISYIEV